MPLNHSFVLLWNQMHWETAVYLEQQLFIWKKGNSTLGGYRAPRQESERTFVYLYVWVGYVWRVMSNNYHWKIVLIYNEYFYV